jgi:ABC-2 type transport system permease protein
MTGLLRAEWTKMRSVRSTKWSLVALIVITLGICSLATAVFTAHWAHLSPTERTQMLNDPIGLILQPAIGFSQVAVCVFAALVISAEHSTGTISATMLATPRRTPVMLAKMVVLFAVVYAVGELLAFGSFFIGQAIISSHVHIALSDPGVLRALLCYGVYLVAVAAFTFGIAAIVRHTAAAITGAVGFVFVLPIFSSFLPGSIGAHVNSLLPASSNAQLMLSTDPHPDYPLSAAVAIGVFALWALVTTSTGTWLTRRRDV